MSQTKVETNSILPPIYARQDKDKISIVIKCERDGQSDDQKTENIPPKSGHGQKRFESR